MQITNIVQGKKDRERVNIFVDGRFKLALDKQTLVSAGWHKGKEISEIDVSETLNQDLRNLLLRRLTAWCFKKPRSEKEIRDKSIEIVDKRVEDQSQLDLEQLLTDVIDKMRARGCGDKDFTDWFVRERIRQRKYGRQKIVSDLLQKGVPLALAKQEVSKNLPDESEIITEVLQKKYKIDSVSDLNSFEEKAQAKRFLYSRGFSDF